MWNSLASKFLNAVGKARSRRPIAQNRDRLQLELLESRNLLSITPSLVQWSPVPPATLQIGQVDTLAVKVSAAPTTSGTSPGVAPTGNVTLTDNSNFLATLPLAADASGSFSTASFNTSTLGAGSHQIAAVYGGDALFSPNYVVANEVVQGSTKTALTSSTNPSVFGQYVIFTATVTPVAPADGTASGIVTFAVDGRAPVSVALSGGVARWYTSNLSPGSHSVVASYLGSSALTPSGDTLASQVVNQANSITTLSVPSVAGVGRSFTMVATVAPQAPGYGHPTGLVTFYDGTTSLGVGTISGSTASLTLPLGLTAGVHQLSAVYGGDVDFLASNSASVTDNIEALATYTVLGSSVNPVVVGQSVTFTATVLTSTGTVAATAAAGSIIFYDGTAVVATVPLVPSTGTTALAQFTTTYTAAGTHAIKAVYAGDTSHSGSFSGVLTEIVSNTKTNTSLYVSSSANPSVVGGPVTFTVSLGGKGATGIITLNDGTTTLASGSPDATGRFTYTTSALTQGPHAITATYSGDANFNSATSPIFTQNVSAASVVTLLSSLNPALPGQPVTFSGTVTPALPNTTKPTGTVSLYDGSVSLTPTPLPLDATGAYSLTVPSLAAGTHRIYVRYNADGNYAPSYTVLNEVVQAL